MKKAEIEELKDEIAELSKTIDALSMQVSYLSSVIACQNLNAGKMTNWWDVTTMLASTDKTMAANGSRE